MRKSLIIFFLSAIVTVVSLPLAVKAVNSQKESVVITETVLLGEKEAAEDINLKINTQYKDRLFWETNVDLGENLTTDTEFTFYASNKVYDYGNRNDVSIYSVLSFGVGSNTDILADEEDMSNNVYYYEVFKDLAEEVSPGQTLTRVVNLADYYDCLQVEGSIYQPEYLDNYSYIQDGEIRKKLTEVIGVKIPEDMQVKVSLTKNEAGEVCDIGMNPHANTIGINGTGTVLPDGCYFSVFAADEEDGTIREEYQNLTGIYKIPIKEMVSELNPDRKFKGLDWDNTQLVYPIDGSIIALETDEALEKLYILLKKEGEIFVQVLDTKNMELKQEVKLESAQKNSYCVEFRVDEEGILIILDRTDGHIYYLENREDKLYTVLDIDALEYKLLENYNSLSDLTYEYDNGRLTLVWRKDRYQSADVYVMLADNTGIKYLAQMENSLNIGANSEIRLDDAEPYQVSFE